MNTLTRVSDLTNPDLVDSSSFLNSTVERGCHMEPHTIWEEQCEATRNIEAEFGTQKALDYLIDVKFIDLKFLNSGHKC